MVDVVDPLQMRVFHQGNLVETRHRLAPFLERGLQAAKALHVGARAHVFVAVQDGQAVDVLDRHHRFREPARRPGRRRPLLAFHRQRICLIPGKAVFRGDDVGGNPLRDKVVGNRNRRVHGNGAAVRSHRHAGHALHTPCHIGHAGPAAHLVGGHVHRLQARGAEAVDADPRHAFGKVRGQNGGARKAGALLAHLGHVAPDHILDRGGVQIVAVLERVQDHRRQARGGHFVQGAVGPALAAHGAGGVVDIGVFHGSSSDHVAARSDGRPGIRS